MSLCRCFLAQQDALSNDLHRFFVAAFYLSKTQYLTIGVDLSLQVLPCSARRIIQRSASIFCSGFLSKQDTHYLTIDVNPFAGAFLLSCNKCKQRRGPSSRQPTQRHNSSSSSNSSSRAKSKSRNRSRLKQFHSSSSSSSSSYSRRRLLSSKRCGLQLQ